MNTVHASVSGSNKTAEQEAPLVGGGNVGAGVTVKAKELDVD